ncbi:NYN domain-containing protein [Cellulomonas edaphi]|uniref:NYN domain-containing protein n=1 Tax=Cellulomonas edaphi TaxID=3053468 RepID=A0ABT7S706_9CELL|nr:NYN domain-containing protein [Cellulomons edaphi]MDM7831407.1 NYN domain-containing protein [Cellulomons edaphi]
MSAPADVPDALRTALVDQAAEVLGRMEPVEVPALLRAVAKFAPRKRATAGAGPLWLALRDEQFRARVAREWASAHADDGERAPLDAAVGSWLRGSDEWRTQVERLPADEPVVVADPRLARLQAELERARTRAERAEEDAAVARAALAADQREMRRLRSDADRARSEARRATQEAQEALEAAETMRRAASADRELAAEDRREAEAVRTAARAEVRVARKLADARVRLLLDTVVDAATGLRAELALAPATDLPADLVAPAQERSAGQRPGSRGRSLDDPALLDEVLRQPWAHLVVDGYNVSKTGFGALPLDEQRRRVVDGLAVVAARTGAEVTCCFDGQEGVAPPGVPGRGGVRVRFSVGEIADDLIRRLVRAEPQGRVVVVVTSDRAVARDVEAWGAWVVPATTLIARLSRV